MDSFVLLVYASLTASRTLLQRLLACLNFTLEAEDLSFWYKPKKMISMDYGSSTSSWKSWRRVRLDLIFSMRDIYINSILNQFTKFTSSSRSMKLKACFHYFLLNFYFSPNDSPLKIMKNIFYFIQKALFLLEIFKF